MSLLSILSNLVILLLCLFYIKSDNSFFSYIEFDFKTTLLEKYREREVGLKPDKELNL
jgi:hypothetical protein